jgi:hypothetical protein
VTRKLTKSKSPRCGTEFEILVDGFESGFRSSIKGIFKVSCILENSAKTEG